MILRKQVQSVIKVLNDIDPHGHYRLQEDYGTKYVVMMDENENYILRIITPRGTTGEIFEALITY